MDEMNAVRQLTTRDGSIYLFQHIALRFGGEVVGDAFALKNNKTLSETLGHHRYRAFANEAAQFSTFMEMPLGEFLLSLKIDGNPLYKRFLNKHGDKSYSVFAIDNTVACKQKGVYAYFVDADLRYIGRCRDTMKQRINQGYGRIHPKNCYIDGQSTNCHLNAKITEAGNSVSLWFCPLVSDDKIIIVEAELIRKYQPEWNIHRF